MNSNFLSIRIDTQRTGCDNDEGRILKGAADHRTWRYFHAQPRAPGPWLAGRSVRQLYIAAVSFPGEKKKLPRQPTWPFGPA